jgi:hypothetical protein
VSGSTPGVTDTVTRVTYGTTQLAVEIVPSGQGTDMGVAMLKAREALIWLRM